MRKKSLALSLMLAFSCLLGGGDLMGQTYQIGSGTNYSTSFPVVKNKEYSVSQQIYTYANIFASTNTDDGNVFNYTQGGTISKLYFYNSNTANVTLDIDVYYLLTTKDSYTNTYGSSTDWLDPDDFTLAYSGSKEFVQSTWTGIDLSSNISYNGTGNIAIMVVNKNCSRDVKFYAYQPGEYSIRQGLCCYSSSEISLENLTITSGSANATINQIRFDFTPNAEDCSKPTNFAFSSVTDSGATLTWNAGNDETEWQIAIDDDDSTNPETIAENVTSRTKAYTDLTSNTTYYAWVRSYCDAEHQSDWVRTSFTTDCEIKTLSYVYGFEEANEFGCWSMKNAHANTGVSSSSTHTGYKKFQFYNSTSNPIQTLITPELNTYGKNGVRVEFYYKPSTTTSAVLKVGYSTDSDDLEDFTWVDNEHNIEVNLASLSSSYWYCFTHDFQLSEIKYIAIQFDRNSSGNNVYIDDIQISEIPTRDLDYEYGFESLPEMGKWTMRYCNPTYTTRITTQKHSGDYGFEFRYNSSFSTQYLISPRLNNDKSGGTLLCYYTKHANANCGFQIGYSSTTLLDDDFTWIPNNDVFTNETTGWEYHEQLCPAGTKYICIKYVATSNTSLFIDDISIFAIDKVHNTDDGYWNYLADWTPAGLPESTDDVYINNTITIPNTCTAEANNIILGPSGSLTIEDGGQLILPKTSTGVQATVKKETYAATPKDAKSYYWYAISSAVANPNISNATNLITETVAPYHYDLYRYNEEKNAELPWENYKNTAYSSTFTTLEKGRGYLYRNASDLSIAMTGEINVADFNYAVTKTESGVLAGFNLIGNPYSHDIYKGAGTAIPNGSGLLRTGFYYMEPTTGKWTTGTDNSTAIKPNEAIFVQTDANGNITMTNTNASSSAKANNDNIMFKVANSQYSDEAYAWFDKGRGLNKISHRNAEVPMLYINQDGENYAIATMSDDIKTFSLNFKAMTMGKYTLSYKTKGEFNYLHVIDRFTGEDVDMLLEGEYSFVASPNDSDARFIVRLEYTSNNGTNDSSVFAYQSGNEIIVSGEGELQIFDVMGRKISTHQINGVETVNVNAHGVYIFKLNEKTQKIIIK